MVRTLNWTGGFSTLPTRVSAILKNREDPPTSIEPVLEHLEDLGILVVQKNQALLASLTVDELVKVVSALLE
jgi:hypothetical protein